MSKKRTTIDTRDPLVPLTKPVFGDPPWAAKCAACGLWFPFANFTRPKYRGKTKPRAARCRACIEAHARAS